MKLDELQLTNAKELQAAIVCVLDIAAKGKAGDSTFIRFNCEKQDDGTHHVWAVIETGISKFWVLEDMDSLHAHVQHLLEKRAQDWGIR